ncbi:uncharacterized protein [Tursiops truncatus]|uniref:uncharacterized protein n=1 Tax=Tursiops truncatus TaxID=9739 RepID=UPI003CCFC8DE
MPGGASVRRRPVPRRLLSGWPPSPAAGMRPGRAGPTGFSGRGGSRAGRSRGRSSAAPVPARRAHAGVALTHRPPGPARPAAPGAPGFHAPGPGTIPAPSRQGPGAPGLTAGRWGRQPSWCPAGLNRKEWLTLQQDSFRSRPWEGTWDRKRDSPPTPVVPAHEVHPPGEQELGIWEAGANGAVREAFLDEVASEGTGGTHDMQGAAPIIARLPQPPQVCLVATQSGWGQSPAGS